MVISKIKKIKDVHDDINKVIEIATDPKFSNIVPEIVNGLTKLMGAGTAIGKVFLEINKPAFEALDAAIAVAEKNWPGVVFPAACGVKFMCERVYT